MSSNGKKRTKIAKKYKKQQKNEILKRLKNVVQRAPLGIQNLLRVEAKRRARKENQWMIHCRE